ncbi:hypothetical protein MVEG_08229 [Podila verticillata NRRL 6337]|nr:hypothetical protein MVEG_08229 [Podila verticillata NRRL 6337]
MAATPSASIAVVSPFSSLAPTSIAVASPTSIAVASPTSITLASSSWITLASSSPAKASLVPILVRFAKVTATTVPPASMSSSPSPSPSSVC